MSLARADLPKPLQGAQFMTEREIAVATFRAVAALYVELTGKPLSLCVETEGGIIRITEGEVRARLADPQESSQKPQASHA